MSGRLDKRVTQLEDARSGATQENAAASERRARLAPYLSDARFEGHREEILTALCDGRDGSAALSYTLRLDPDPLEANWISVIFLDWSTRDVGGDPSVTRVTLPKPGQHIEPITR